MSKKAFGTASSYDVDAIGVVLLCSFCAPWLVLEPSFGPSPAAAFAPKIISVCGAGGLVELHVALQA